jgi:AcrR family transcriptional regulator
MSAAERRETILAAAAQRFAEHGYRGAPVDQNARRSGVTPPVIYEHFPSKQELYRELLERHFSDLRRVWSEHFAGEGPPADRAARSIDAWFAYVEAHPFTGRVLFRPAIDPEIDAIHAEVAASSRREVMPLFAAEPGTENLAGPLVGEGLEMAWVVLRGVLQGLAIWWTDHPEVPRARVVATAMNALWLGLERVQSGETWRGGAESPLKRAPRPEAAP